MNLTSEGSIYMKEKVKNAIGVLLIYGLINFIIVMMQLHILLEMEKLK